MILNKINPFESINQFESQKSSHNQNQIITKTYFLPQTQKKNNVHSLEDPKKIDFKDCIDFSKSKK